MQRRTFGKKPGKASLATGIPAKPAAPAGAPLPSYAALLGTAAGDTSDSAPHPPVAAGATAITERDMLDAFGAEWAKLRAVWHRVNAGGPGISWSFPAFCFGGLWLLYRRQYFWGALVLSVTFFSEKLPIVTAIYAYLGISILCGLLGPRALVTTAIRRIQKIKQRGGEAGVIATRIASHGGTDMLTPLGYTIITTYIKISQMPALGSFGNVRDVIRTLAL